MQSATIIAITFAVYLAGMLLIGLLAWRRTRDLADYLLAGRRLGCWVAALSAGASDMSGWLLLGLPGYAYAAGLEAVWIAVGLLAGTWLNWRLVAAPLRDQTAAQGDALTLPDFLSNRYDRGLPLIRLTAAGFIIVFFLFYTSSGLVAAGKLFTATFGLPYELAVTAGLLTVVVYTFLGGFLAVSWTDLIQSLLMLAALVMVPLAVFAGSIPETATLISGSPLLDPFTDVDGNPLGLLATISLLAWGLGYFGQPHILARFMAIHSSAAVPQARRIAVGWTMLTLAGAILVGLAGIDGLTHPLTGVDSEKVFIRLVGLLFHPLVAGFLLAAILAAIMSTADSQLLVASSSLTEDLYKTLLRRDASQRELVLVGRIGVLVIALVAWWLAMTPDSKVLDLVAYAWAGFGAGFGPAILLTLYWRGARRLGILLGIIVGGLTVILWRPLSGGLFDLYEIVPGFIFSLLTIIVVSRIERTAGDRDAEMRSD